MGNESSTIKSRGSLQGAYPPAHQGITMPSVPLLEKAMTVPTGKKAGDTLIVNVDGVPRSARVPVGVKAGGKFYLRLGHDIKKVYASTLPTIPGMEIVNVRPIIWGSVSHSYCTSQSSGGERVTVGKLLQQAQAEILEQAAAVGCNAVLGMSFNVSNDSSGETGNYKLIIVTACGTPCSVVPMANAPAVEANVVVEPLYS